MALSAVKTFVAGEVLFASDLNAEFSNIYNSGEDLITPATKAHDMNGLALVMDVDADSEIIASTDDRIDMKLGGVTGLFRFDGTTASSVNGIDFFTAATGAEVSILPNGETNVSINLKSKGTGDVYADGSPAGSLAAQVFSF